MDRPSVRSCADPVVITPRARASGCASRRREAPTTPPYPMWKAERRRSPPPMPAVDASYDILLLAASSSSSSLSYEANQDAQISFHTMRGAAASRKL
jgi:hypothetical protein